MYNRGRIITEEERISLHTWANSMIENYNINSKREKSAQLHYNIFLKKKEIPRSQHLYGIKKRV